jgi:hypothetical protein
MPSIPSVYPQVASRCFMSFRVLKLSISTGQHNFRAGFDSRQLHTEEAGQGQKPCPAFFFVNIRVKIRVPICGGPLYWLGSDARPSAAQRSLVDPSVTTGRPSG